MRISIFGLGYVGIVTAACLAQEGHQVIGVDVARHKVESINAGQPTIVERELDRMVAETVAAGRLRATADHEQAIADSEIAIVCVGTPSSENGSLDTQYVERVVTQIGTALSKCDKEGFLLVSRSTVLPGTTRQLVLPTLEQASGRAPGQGYDVLYHPEFLREGSSVEDFYHPPKIVVGEQSPGTAQVLLNLYDGIEAPRFVTSLEAAELIKYADNAFHAVKITFANEIGQLCQKMGICSHEVMDVFRADTKLNISPAYLRPGFAFGGSCLPKDVRALMYQGQRSDLRLPLLEGVLPSNHEQVESVLRRIERHHPAQIGLVGLAFKPGTDDLRESPLVTLAERLLGKGYGLRIYDPQVEIARLVGGNRSYVERHLPHLSRLMVSSLDDLCHCDMIVVGHPLHEEALMEGWLEERKTVLDLVGNPAGVNHPHYEGLYW